MRAKGRGWDGGIEGQEVGYFGGGGDWVVVRGEEGFAGEMVLFCMGDVFLEKGFDIFD